MDELIESSSPTCGLETTIIPVLEGEFEAERSRLPEGNDRV